ncbi:MAG: hypothetical protein P8Z77_10910, partial [Candidatus Thiodiazotropha sp.]
LSTAFLSGVRNQKTESNLMSLAALSISSFVKRPPQPGMSDLSAVPGVITSIRRLLENLFITSLFV